MKRVFIAWLSGLLLISGCAPAAFDIDKAVFETQISKVYEGMSLRRFKTYSHSVFRAAAINTKKE